MTEVRGALEAKIGFIGLDVMGAGMAMNLLEAGFAVVVHDRRREAAAGHETAGAAWAASTRELAQACEVIVSCLPSVEAIEAVALGAEGLIHGLRQGQVYFETSTGQPALIKRIHAAFAAHGVQVLDTPISGGARGVQLGRLAFWVGGDKALFERHLPVLRGMGTEIVHVGAIGAGLVTKLVNNGASQSIQAAIAESFVLGVKAGADPLGLWEASLQSVVGRRRSYDSLIKEFLPNRYERRRTRRGDDRGGARGHPGRAAARSRGSDRRRERPGDMNPHGPRASRGLRAHHTSNETTWTPRP